MPVDPEKLMAIARADFAFEKTIEGPGTYMGSVIPLPGTVTVRVQPDGINAVIAERNNWQGQAAQHAPDFVSGHGWEFRPDAPGQLIARDCYGAIESTADWKASHVLYLRREVTTPHRGDGDFYFFNVGILEFGDVSATPGVLRCLYRRGAIGGYSSFSGKDMYAHAFTDDKLDPDLQRMSIAFNWNATELEREAVWHATNLVAGQTLRHIATEAYADDGTLLWTRYRVGAHAGDRHRQYFHPLFPDFGKLAPNGWATIAEGFHRLLEFGFPIENVLHHFHHATGRPYDIDAQHLILAIHTAFEAWNRAFGQEYLVGKNRWAKIASRLRAPMKELDVYKSLGENMEKNLRDSMAHANRTEMSWREAQFFEALKIDIADESDKRALGYRNELLHNGFFLKRFRHLTEPEQRQRVADIERLRRLALISILKLAGYAGDFRSPVTTFAEHVESKGLTLPTGIAAAAAVLPRV